MKNSLQKTQALITVCFLIFSHAVRAQCLTIAATDVTVTAATGSCGAVVNYGSPTVIANCGVSTNTFTFTGAIVTWTVPTGVTSLTITTKGAQGGYNSSSATTSGLGAEMKGIFTVTPGQILKILVGEQPSNGSGNGGGGGTFVTDISNNPLIIAGGGGGSAQTTDSPSKHGQITTSGGTGAAGGGNGGTSGSGGSIGASGFQAGAGGGLLTDGANGWTGGTGGLAFVNGGAGASTNAPARGGFGGGGSGSSYVVGGGGGGYSGGGSGGNTTAGVGGGGGSYNAGTSQVNTGGVNSGHGQVVIDYIIPATYTVTQTAGLTSGSSFPLGTTVQSYSVIDSFSNTSTGSFSVTVIDIETPTVTCPANAASCVSVVNSIGPVAVLDNCPSPSVTYTFSGATSGSGSSNANGTAFNIGITTVTYAAQDNSGNRGSCVFSVTINPVPVVAASSNFTAICQGQTASLTATGANSYSWSSGPSGSVIAVNPSSTTAYTVTGTSLAGCTNTFALTQLVNQNPTVTATTNFSAICQGQTASLTATGANTYSWSTTGSGSLIAVNPASTTSYTVTGINTTGCTHTFALTQVVNPNPTVTAITNFSAICQGQTASLTATGANSYSWSSGPSGSVIAVNPSSTTIYTVTGTNLAGCTHTFALTQIVNVNPTITAASNFSAICSGQSATLTATGANTYSWSTTGSGSLIAVNPVSTTSYTVTGINTTGCTHTFALTQVVNPNPTVTATTNFSAICEGQTASLTATGADSYNWSSGPSGFVIAVSPSSTMIYTVTGTNLAGCTHTFALTQIVNVNPTITAASNFSAICSGQSATLTATGANNYSWSSGSSTNTEVVSPFGTSTYTVTGTDLAGCSGTFALIQLVNPGPTITAVSSSTAICNGQSATLTLSGADTYSWNSGSTTATLSVSPLTTATYTGTGTNNAGCSGTFAIVQVVHANPTVTIVSEPLSLCAGESASLTANGADTYLWSTGLTTSVIVVNPVATNIYTLDGVDVNGCFSTSSFTLAVSECVSIEKYTGSRSLVTIYPNPTRDEITISLSATDSHAMIQIYNALGQLVMQNGDIVSNSKMDLNCLPGGVYYVKVNEPGKPMVTARILKQN